MIARGIIRVIDDDIKALSSHLQARNYPCQLRTRQILVQQQVIFQVKAVF
jgi:hypothetical protein